ncbi:hypothetical protein IDJ81_14060 [Tsuneonella flava]|uniref:Uncharacterized protein n=1 Tax=Tsuneonella flava TaxID=2055955 RepID=A0ABX7K812_9SPHN|nr:hypothetical protein [Tsuneonella flava]QSB44409.1 hypothetical protein IDJ81_14060 [Tsuneonella flava]
MIASNLCSGARLLSLAAAITLAVCANALVPAFILDGAILLVRTDFSTRWPGKAPGLGMAERNATAVASLHFPSLSAEPTHILMEERAIAAAKVPGFETVAHLHRLPVTGGSNGPLRIDTHLRPS